MYTKRTLAEHLRWLVYSIIVGVMGGLAATVFLKSLRLTTEYREANEHLIWLLPFAGLFIGWVYVRFEKHTVKGTHLIFEEIHNPKNVLPLLSAPFILIGTLLSHLFGASSGREGTAVQMSASLADQLSKFFKIESTERKILLIAGAGAGFSAAIGAPLAGAIFGMEAIHIGRLKPMAWMECFVASYVAYYTAIYLGTEHLSSGAIQFDQLTLRLMFVIAICGIVFGLTSRVFVSTVHFLEEKLFTRIKNAQYRPLVAGIALIILYIIYGTKAYAGLSLPLVMSSFETVSSIEVPIKKAIATAITISGGFKGGEFIPLVLIGASLGSFLSQLFAISTSFLAALGFAAVFGAASNTPIACAIMAAEIFDYRLAPYSLLVCLIAYHVSGHRGIYKNQKIANAKIIRR